MKKHALFLIFATGSVCSVIGFSLLYKHILGVNYIEFDASGTFHTTVETGTYAISELRQREHPAADERQALYYDIVTSELNSGLLLIREKSQVHERLFSATLTTCEGNTCYVEIGGFTVENTQDLKIISSIHAPHLNSLAINLVDVHGRKNIPHYYVFFLASILATGISALALVVQQLVRYTRRQKPSRNEDVL